MAALSVAFNRLLNRFVARAMDARRPNEPQPRAYDLLARRRIGRFYLDESVLIDPDGLQILFDDMVVLWAELDYTARRRRYIAYHPSFDLVEEGSQCPEYIAEFEAGSIKPTWRRVAAGAWHGSH
jgi:hypothetical protein